VSDGERMASVPSVGSHVGDVRAAAETATPRPRRLDVWGAGRRALPPIVIGSVTLAVWELIVRLNEIPSYILPGPLLILTTLVHDWGTLYPSLLVTLAITGAALIVATVAGVAIAILFTQSKLIELSLFPYAVILQVTPVVAIAPLIIIWVKNIPVALLICAWIVAFFPIVSNTTLGLNSADHNLLNLFQLYGASRRQVFWHLRLRTCGCRAPCRTSWAGSGSAAGWR
jgi:NitT/TauT family transport system permease protein